MDLVAAADRDALLHPALGERPRRRGQREDAGDERARPDPAEHDRAEQRQRRSRPPAAAQLVVMANASLVGCSTMTVQLRSGTRAPRASFSRWSGRKIANSAARRAILRAPASGSGSPGSTGSATSRFLAGLPCAMSAVGREDQRVALVADADLIDESPQLFERDAAISQPLVVVRLRRIDRSVVGRPSLSRKIGGDLDALRREDAVDGPGLRRTDAAGRDHAAAGVEQRDLAELGELEHVVLEDARLLPLRQRRAELLADRRRIRALLSM